MRCSGPYWPAEKRISPRELQLPPLGKRASASTCGGPPDASILFNFPSAKKPIEALSGDQKRPVAPSVPASKLGESESSGRTQMECLAPAACATKATSFPSGETTA